MFFSMEEGKSEAILLSDLRRMLTVYSKACVFHSRIGRNTVQALADDLGAERTAMSAELSRM